MENQETNESQMAQNTPQTDSQNTKSGPQIVDQENEKVIAVLSYLWILFVIPLLVAKDNKFAQFHAKQGLVLFIAEIVTMVVVMVPIIGWILAPIAWIAWFIFAVMGIMNVVKGEMKPLPLIGKFAEKF